MKKDFIFIFLGNDKRENVSEQRYKERLKTFEKYERFDFIPLSEYAKGK